MSLNSVQILHLDIFTHFCSFMPFLCRVNYGPVLEAANKLNIMPKYAELVLFH